jgi:hypothetical protein
MKKNLFLLIIQFVLLTNANAKYVRFAVNVSNTTVAQNDLYMTSSFQSLKNLGIDFQSGFLHMYQHPTDTNIYYYTIDLPAFAVYEYQIEKGFTGYEKEWVPVESRSPNDYRWVYVDSLNTDTLQLPEVLFGDNNTLTDTMYRFQVNMSNETVAATGVHIAGDFQGNNAATSRMYSFSNNIYEYMAWFTPASMQHFLYVNGNTSGNAEAVPNTCAMAGKRMISSVTNAQILPLVCFGECTNCAPAAVSNYQLKNSILMAQNFNNNTCDLQFKDNNKMHHIAIMDCFGRTIQKLENIVDNSIQVNLNQLPPSVYLLNVYNQKGDWATFKVIVQ